MDVKKIDLTRSFPRAFFLKHLLSEVGGNLMLRIRKKRSVEAFLLSPGAICYAFSFLKGESDNLSLLFVMTGRIRLAVNHATPKAINAVVSQ